MKQTLLITIVAILALGSAAYPKEKGIHSLRYTIDTFHYYKQTALIQRYNKDALGRIASGTGADAMLARALKELQPLLDRMRAYITENKEIDFISDAKLFLSDIQGLDKKFDATNYRNELNFYANINVSHRDKRVIKE
ncbi:MAG: hypothetical protein K0Q79_1518 [Flavipsychrobacter sp.]|jgi:hypothetical protein|nr:hypothetical protein [Flavipsychrobacter sp.]